MRALRQKAKSQNGASITFALLLFLVCAIISSVVIVAATAVGGRASKMAEMDQRYYAVNSAAELLRDALEEPTVTIITGTKTESKVDLDGNELSKDDPVDLDDEMYFSLDEGTTKTTFTVDDTYLVATAAMRYAGLLEEDLETLSLEAASADIADATALEVTMKPVCDEDKLTIDVYNTNTEKGVYKLSLTFKADTTQSDNERTTFGTPLSERDTNGNIVYYKKKTVIDTTIKTIRWKMIDLQVAPAATPTANPGGGI